jgi:hypothetical protein
MLDRKKYVDPTELRLRCVFYHNFLRLWRCPKSLTVLSLANDKGHQRVWIATMKFTKKTVVDWNVNNVFRFTR